MTTTEAENRLDARSFLDKPKLLEVIPGDGSITGISVLNSELFVVRGSVSPSQVNVYNTNSFTWTRNITITGSSGLRAVVASPRYNCLYVSDPDLKAVHLYNLSNNVTTQWSVSGWCRRLSLTSTHNVLVTQWDTRRVKEYSPDGSRLIREISLDGSIEYPHHSVQLSSDQLVVSHGSGGTLHECV